MPLHLLNKSPSRNALFIHIPKTAGMSLYYALEKEYGKKNSRRWPARSELTDYYATTDKKLRKLRFISGHFRYAEFFEKDNSKRFVFAVLRNPLDRLVSVYRYLKSDPNHPRHSLVIGKSLQQFLSTRPQSMQCLQISGTNDFTDTLGFIKKNVDLVGTVEKFDSFLDALSRGIGSAAPITLEHHNKTPGKPVYQKELDPDIVARFQGDSCADYRLWQHVINKENNIEGRQAG